MGVVRTDHLLFSQTHDYHACSFHRREYLGQESKLLMFSAAVEAQSTEELFPPTSGLFETRQQ